MPMRGQASQEIRVRLVKEVQITKKRVGRYVIFFAVFRVS